MYLQNNSIPFERAIKNLSKNKKKPKGGSRSPTKKNTPLTFDLNDMLK